RGESVFCHGSVLMVINDLRVIDVALAPFKTNAPLVVDANTVLTFTVTEQFFEVIGWWYAQILQRVCAIQDLQLAPRNALNVLRQLARDLAPKQLCGFLVLKALDHGGMITQAVMIVERYYQGSLVLVASDTIIFYRSGQELGCLGIHLPVGRLETHNMG